MVSERRRRGKLPKNRHSGYPGSNTNGPFDVYASDSFFRYDEAGFVVSSLTAQLPPNLSAARLSADLTIDGAFVGGGRLGKARFTCTNCAFDVNAMQLAMRAANDPSDFDLQGDGIVDERDLSYLVSELLRTSFGDANLDGHFRSDDIVQVFTSAQYDDEVAGNSIWSSGDWNGDGDFDSRDLLNAFQSGKYQRGLSTAPEFGPVSFSASDLDFEVDSIQLVDLDNDVDADLLVHRRGRLPWFESQPFEEPFRRRSNFNSIGRIFDFDSGDIDGDGTVDVITQVDDTFVWFRNNGEGNFSNGIALDKLVLVPSLVDLVDMDGDGDLDVLTGEFGTANWIENIDGNGTFRGAHRIFRRISDAGALDFTSVSGDLDNDGDADVLFFAFQDGLSLLENFGDSFVGHSVGHFMYVNSVSIIDIDGDDRLDVAVSTDERNVFLRNNGDWTFTQSVSPVSARSFFVDLDEDEDPELITDGEWFENVDGAFADQANATELFHHVLASGDIDGDGDTDIIVSDNRRVFLLTNRAIDG